MPDSVVLGPPPVPPEGELEHPVGIGITEHVSGVESVVALLAICRDGSAAADLRSTYTYADILVYAVTCSCSFFIGRCCTVECSPY